MKKEIKILLLLVAFAISIPVDAKPKPRFKSLNVYSKQELKQTKRKHKKHVQLHKLDKRISRFCIK